MVIRTSTVIEHQSFGVFEMGRFALLFRFFVLLAVVVFGSPASGAERLPNVVFFLVDDLGWRDVGCFGSSFYETPNIDQFAKESVRFTQAYAACHVCSPTRASIMTGKYPARLHLTDWLPGRKEFRVSEAQERRHPAAVASR